MRLSWILRWILEIISQPCSLPLVLGFIIANIVISSRKISAAPINLIYLIVLVSSACAAHVKHVNTQIIETHQVISAESSLVDMLPKVTQSVHVIRVTTDIYVNRLLLIIINLFVIVIIFIFDVFFATFFLVIVLLEFVVIVVLILLGLFLVLSILNRLIGCCWLRVNSGERPPGGL